jgi:pimeloyl-ACP methyl ester carboxylesterase
MAVASASVRARSLAAGLLLIAAGVPPGASQGRPRADATPRAQGGAVPRPDPADRFATVNGLRIHYVDWGGSGPPFIMVHGLDRVARTFDHVAPHFTDRYRVLAVDMRGHGDSAWDPAARYRVEDHVGDLEGLVAQLGLTQLVLWGNSTGGRVVQVFAGLHPDLVSHVISEDVGPERPRQISDSYSRRVLQEEAGWASEAELLAQLRKASPATSDAVLMPYVRYGTKPRADGRIVWKRDPNLVKGFVATDLWRFVRSIRAPILYVLGGRSTIVPPDTQAELTKTLPRVQIVTMPGAGHYPSDERPEEFLAIVDRFLAAGG